jgi:hypothetical protein
MSKNSKLQNSPFPLGDIPLQRYDHLVEILRRIHRIQIALDTKSVVPLDFEKRDRSVLEGIIYSMFYIETDTHMKPTEMIFADCLSDCGEGLLYASSFRFNQYVCIEANKQGHETMTVMERKVTSLRGVTEIIFGSLQDYFPFHANVLMMNTVPLCNSMCDEGAILGLFFKLCLRCLQGSYVIAITTLNRIPVELRSNECGSLTELYSMSLCVDTVNEAKLFLYKV